MPPSRNRTRSQTDLRTPQPRQSGFVGYRPSPNIPIARPNRQVGVAELKQSLGIIDQISNNLENQAEKEEIDKARADAYGSQINDMIPPNYYFKEATNAWMRQKGDLYGNDLIPELENKIINEYYPESKKIKDDTTYNPNTTDLINRVDNTTFKNEAEWIKKQTDEYLDTFLTKQNITDLNFLSGFYPRVNLGIKNAITKVKELQSKRYVKNREDHLTSSITNVITDHLSKHKKFPDSLNEGTIFDSNGNLKTFEHMAKQIGIPKERVDELFVETIGNIAVDTGRFDLLGQPKWKDGTPLGMFSSDPKKSGWSLSKDSVLGIKVLDFYQRALDKHIALENAEQAEKARELEELRKTIIKDTWNSVIKDYPDTSRSEINRIVMDRLRNDPNAIDANLPKTMSILENYQKFTDIVLKTDSFNKLQQQAQMDASNNVLPINSKALQLIIKNHPKKSSSVFSNFIAIRKENDRDTRFKQSQNIANTKKEDNIKSSKVLNKMFKTGTLSEQEKNNLIISITNPETKIYIEKYIRAFEEATDKKQFALSQQQKNEDDTLIKNSLVPLLDKNKLTIEHIKNLHSGKLQTTWLQKLKSNEDRLIIKQEKLDQAKAKTLEKRKDTILNNITANMPIEKLMSGEYLNSYDLIKTQVQSLLTNTENIDDFGDVIVKAQTYARTLLTGDYSDKDRVERLRKERLGKQEQKHYRQAIEYATNGEPKKAEIEAGYLKDGEHAISINNIINQQKNRKRIDERWEKEHTDKLALDEWIPKVSDPNIKVTIKDINDLKISGRAKRELHSINNMMMDKNISNTEKADKIKRFNMARSAMDAIMKNRALNAEQAIAEAEENFQLQFRTNTLAKLYKADKWFSEFSPVDPTKDVFTEILKSILFDKAIPKDFQESIEASYELGKITQKQNEKLLKLLADRLTQTENKTPFNIYKSSLARISKQFPADNDLTNRRDEVLRDKQINILQTELQTLLHNKFLESGQSMYDPDLQKELKELTDQFIKENISIGRWEKLKNKKKLAEQRKEWVMENKKHLSGMFEFLRFGFNPNSSNINDIDDNVTYLQEHVDPDKLTPLPGDTKVKESN